MYVCMHAKQSKYRAKGIFFKMLPHIEFQKKNKNKNNKKPGYTVQSVAVIA